MTVVRREVNAGFDELEILPQRTEKTRRERHLAANPSWKIAKCLPLSGIGSEKSGLVACRN